ncbi:MAG: SMP-30/gluconolactonase/LRE family protein [Planktotalea sp.]|uniref:SMP-30/gluconolactonase/LRE family protein n=1 Tax=Planktotalea sp. TaxID=2029877 RepID=UPI003C758330
MIFDDRVCGLGEGPLWHPLRRELFWFDINANTLHTKAQSWTFDKSVSAAGWLDADRLLIASQIGLHVFDINEGSLAAPLVAIEADNGITRSNDGRTDPWGGFWIGTMGFDAEPDAGAIYRFHKGELRTIASDITVANSICFTPDRKHAHYTDTMTQQVMRVALDPITGWPCEDAQVWLDLTGENLNPDGAVIDANGTFWVALWGASRVNGYAQDGRLIASHSFDARHTSCPAFGGDDLSDLYVTSATQGIRGDLGNNGKTFCVPNVSKGQQEHQVIL